MRGGLRLPGHKPLSAASAIARVPASSELVLSLEQHANVALDPVVAAGAQVKMGQMIARSADLFGADLHAPVSGEVIAIEPRPVPLRHGAWGSAIVIRSDRLEQRENGQPLTQWSQLAPAKLCEVIARGGIVGLGGAVFPAATKLAAHADRALEYLLLNGVECEPYITCDDRLMRERAALVIRGAQILLHASTAKQCLIAVEDDKPEALEALATALTAAKDARIQLRRIEIAYPSGDEGQLIGLLLHKEIPRGGLPADLGVVCQNVGTAAAVANWIEQGRPLIDRIVTVTGSGVANPCNVEVSIGTPIADLIAAAGGYAGDVRALVMGGSMMGLALPDDGLPVVKATNCLIAATAADLLMPAVELPCIRCGNCMDACPVGLLPQQLHAHVLGGNRVALQELGLKDCIECGCCDYVCPSHIPLVSRFHEAKRR
jgi:Na+-translocating ferredoxin:NAD+ oxidoreductase subunit C